MGQILLNHYSSQELAEKATSLGAISFLDKSCDTPPDGHTFETPCGGYTVAYCRDRKELWSTAAPGTGSTAEQAISNMKTAGAEYSYLWNGEAWHLITADRGCVPLASILAG